MNTRQPLVTIGISTYNRADSYLPQALDSALAQTYPNLEVLVSDNCSTDSTPDLVRSRNSDRLRYIRHDRNIGANNNFNYCLSQARGEYFLLLHDDDQIDSDFVAACVAALPAEGEVGVVRSGTRMVDAHNNVLSSTPNHSQGLSPFELFMAWFDRNTAFYLCSTLYNTRRLREHGGFNTPKNLFQDVAAIAALATRYGHANVEGVKASFRRHDANKGSGDSVLDWAEDSLFLLELLAELMPEHAGELRAAGLPYLCRKCYRNASSIPGHLERWRTMLTLYERFERTYSPVGYTLERLRLDAKASAREMLQAPRRVQRTSGSA